MGIATEDHLSGFLNYLVRKFLFVREGNFVLNTKGKAFRKFIPEKHPM